MQKGFPSRVRISPHSKLGRFTIPKHANKKFRTYCNKVFGGQWVFDTLVQLGDMPAEMVDAFNYETDRRLDAIEFPKLDEQLPQGAPRNIDPPDPISERPSYMKKKARQCIVKAKKLECEASTRRQTWGAEADRAKAREYRDQAKVHDKERNRIQQQLTRAVKHPCTEYTYEASGAAVGESPLHYVRAICTALGWLGMDKQIARRLANVGGVGKGKVKAK